jgi:hypothetical protein
MLRGTPVGLSATRSRTISRDSPGMPPLGRARPEHFGWSLAAGDVDRDGDDDLLVGSIGEYGKGFEAAGRVLLIRGREWRHHDRGRTTIQSNSPNVPGRPFREGYFGQCVELVDLDGDR